MLRIIHPYQKVPASVQLLACGAGVFFGLANVLLAKAHVKTRKEGKNGASTLRVTNFTLRNLPPS